MDRTKRLTDRRLSLRIGPLAPSSSKPSDEQAEPAASDVAESADQAALEPQPSAAPDKVEDPHLNRAARLVAEAVQTVFSISDEVKRSLAGDPIEVDGKTLDLDIQLAVRLVGRGTGGVPSGSALSMGFARLSMKQTSFIVAGTELPVVGRETTLRGVNGDLRAKLFTPGPETRRDDGGLILFVHGGGFALCGIETHEAQMRRLAHSSGQPVLLTEYAKAPEQPWPAGVDDVWSAFLDTAARAAEFGADPAKIMVAGDSAGGNLAAVVARRARDARRLDSSSPVPAGQLLIYPSTDLRTIEYESRKQFGHGFWLSLEQMTAFGEFYAADGADRSHPDMSPLAADDVSDLAPAIVVTGGFDPLHDEGKLYADRLRAAGVPVDYRCYDGMTHSFFGMQCFDGPRQASIDISEAAGRFLSALD
jgi:acetyl esterase